ncbi:hypothetical protein C8Q77DRAFT_796114 [Trametes polyzona]|nr:hypothetical protein C8Q77DRAFT_796114 [Trametes polyzona]
MPSSSPASLCAPDGVRVAFASSVCVARPRARGLDNVVRPQPSPRPAFKHVGHVLSWPGLGQGPAQRTRPCRPTWRPCSPRHESIRGLPPSVTVADASRLGGISRASYLSRWDVTNTRSVPLRKTSSKSRDACGRQDTAVGDGITEISRATERDSENKAERVPASARRCHQWGEGPSGFSAVLVRSRVRATGSDNRELRGIPRGSFPQIASRSLRTTLAYPRQSNLQAMSVTQARS